MSEQAEEYVVETEAVDESIDEATTTDTGEPETKPEQVDAEPEQLEQHAEQTVPLQAMLEERRKRQEYQHFIEEMRAKEQQPAPQQQPTAGEPRLEDFDDYDKYQRAMVDHRVQQQLGGYVAQQRQQQAVQQFTARLEAASSSEGKPADFQQRVSEVFQDRELPISQVMAEVILTDDTGPDLAYYLHANPKEMRRISNMAGAAQAAAMGRLAERLANKRVSVSGAPPPVKSVRTSKGNASPDPSKMSTDEWMAWRRKQIQT